MTDHLKLQVIFTSLKQKVSRSGIRRIGRQADQKRASVIAQTGGGSSL
jgi:hypothetical protein